MILGVLKRIGHVAFDLFKLVDAAACFVWLAPLYIVGLADRPTGTQLISSYVGRAKYNGHRWGRIAAAVIDWGAQLFGDKPDHCVRSFLKHEAHKDAILALRS